MRLRRLLRQQKGEGAVLRKMVDEAGVPRKTAADVKLILRTFRECKAEAIGAPVRASGEVAVVVKEAPCQGC